MPRRGKKRQKIEVRKGGGDGFSLKSIVGTRYFNSSSGRSLRVGLGRCPSEHGGEDGCTKVV
eukprot:202794-Amorphochlora_amoeboformis.AAC.1